MAGLRGIAKVQVNDPRSRRNAARLSLVFDKMVGLGLTLINGLLSVKADAARGIQVTNDGVGIKDDGVTFSLMQNIDANRLIGRQAGGGGGDMEQIGLGGGVELSGAFLQRQALTGDVTAAAASNTTTIANEAVTYPKIQNVSAASKLLGRGDSGAGDVEEITLGTGLMMSGTTLSVTGGGGTTSKSIVGGRLTLVTGGPAGSGASGVGTLYYSPYLHDEIALYDGSDWVVHTFTEVSLSLTVTSGTNYDVFIYDNSGTLTLELSDAWTDGVTRDDALALQDEVWVKTGDATRRWLGVIRSSASNQCSDTVTQRFVSNYYNKISKTLLKNAATNSWTLAGSGGGDNWRAWNASAANHQVEFVIANPTTSEFSIQASTQVVALFAHSGGSTCRIGTGFDRTNGNDGAVGGAGNGSAAAPSTNVNLFLSSPVAGYHFLCPVESNPQGGGTTMTNFGGTIAATGIIGTIEC